MVQHCNFMRRVREMNEIFYAWIDMTYIVLKWCHKYVFQLYEHDVTVRQAFNTTTMCKLFDFCKIKNIWSGKWYADSSFTFAMKENRFFEGDLILKMGHESTSTHVGQHFTIQRFFLLFICWLIQFQASWLWIHLNKPMCNISNSDKQQR
jgi:hypothetical protein